MNIGHLNMPTASLNVQAIACVSCL